MGQICHIPGVKSDYRYRLRCSRAESQNNTISLIAPSEGRKLTLGRKERSAAGIQSKSATVVAADNTKPVSPSIRRRVSHNII